jgi:uncharacterized protein (DUF302 family)
MTTSSSDAKHSAGVLRFKSPHAFDDTVQRLLAALKDHGIKVFATIDQRAEAQAVGLSMPSTVLVLFGNPKGGAPLMLANPEAGIDLPLKILISESEPGRVDVFINSAEYIIQRHALPHELLANIAPVERLIVDALNGQHTRDSSVDLP